jgi:hypothetical protein
MRLCFVIPAKRSDTAYTPGFLMNWTDLVLKCAQRGHQVFVSQEDTRPECFNHSGTDVFDAYVCIDPDVVFASADVFKLLESPHDVTGALMMSGDAISLTCGKKPDEITSDEYMEVNALEPSFVVVQKIPEGWNYTDKIKAHIDTSIRIGHRVTLNI